MWHQVTYWTTCTWLRKPFPCHASHDWQGHNICHIPRRLHSLSLAYSALHQAPSLSPHHFTISPVLIVLSKSLWKKKEKKGEESRSSCGMQAFWAKTSQRCLGWHHGKWAWHFPLGNTQRGNWFCSSGFFTSPGFRCWQIRGIINIHCLNARCLLVSLSFVFFRWSPLLGLFDGSMRWRVFLRSAVVRLSRILRTSCQYSFGHIDDYEEILEDLESLLGGTGKRVLTIKVEIDDIMTSDNHLHVNGVANVRAAAKTDPK